MSRRRLRREYVVQNNHTHTHALTHTAHAHAHTQTHTPTHAHAHTHTHSLTDRVAITPFAVPICFSDTLQVTDKLVRDAV
jgi:hypothetical protein